MANLIDYVEWRGDVDFNTSPLNEVDALILCQIEYNNFDNLLPSEFTKKGITLSELAASFAESPDFITRSDVGAMINPLTVNLLQAASTTKRFGGLKMCGYINKIDLSKEEQFAAVTYVLDDGSFFIAYRGTDDTIVGWKEDFNLGWEDTVPAQVDALKYLEDASKALRGKIYVGGHSKGGNLTVYSVANASEKIKNRVAAAFNNDGPGFSGDFFKSEKFLSVENKIQNYVPELSIIGMLFSHADNYITVESDEKGLHQHDPFSWHVSAHNFVECPDTNKQSKFIGETVNTWFNELDKEHKELFVETIFGVLKDTNAKTNSELTANWWNTIKAMLKSMTKLDAKTRDIVFKTIQLLFKTAQENVVEKLKADNRKK
ncbi:MAG: Mbeg1-like protein [Treponema sp.]